MGFILHIAKKKMWPLKIETIDDVVQADDWEQRRPCLSSGWGLLDVDFACTSIWLLGFCVFVVSFFTVVDWKVVSLCDWQETWRFSCTVTTVTTAAYQAPEFERVKCFIQKKKKIYIYRYIYYTVASTFMQVLINMVKRFSSTLLCI